MKTMKKLQVAVAASALCAVGNVALAASISQSGETIAREVISKNVASTQRIRGSAVSYNFDNGPTAQGNGDQFFNITLHLNANGGDGAPEWFDPSGINYARVSAVRRNNGNIIVPVVPAGAMTGEALKVGIELLGVEYVVAADLPAAEAAAYLPRTAVRYRFRYVNNTPTAFSLGDLQITFNATNPGNGTLAPYNLAAFPAIATPLDSTRYAEVTKLANSVTATPITVGSGVGTTGEYGVCGEAQRHITVRARNYIGAGPGVEGESAGSPQASLVNSGYLVFETALTVQMGRGAAKDRATDPTSNNTLLTIPTGSGTSSGIMSIGFVKFTNRPNISAKDVDLLTTPYQFNAATGGTRDGDLGTPPPEPQSDGDVDVASLTLALKASNGFAPGAAFFLSNSPTCIAGGGDLVTPPIVATLSADGTVANGAAAVTFSHANLAAIAQPAPSLTLLNTRAPAAYPAYYGSTPAAFEQYYVCQQFPGGAVQIPQSAYTGVATLDKESTTALPEESNFSCVAPLAGLGGGVKIDVRNFFPYDPANPSNEWIGVIRVINNSETSDADLTGQYIRADGKYGKWGALGTLPARGARYFLSSEINTLLNQNTTSAGAAITDNTGPGGITAPAGQALQPNTRLRISSNSASTLRVQSYIYNATTRALVEVSASQGADFVNIESSGRDHIDQDAQTGIKK